MCAETYKFSEKVQLDSLTYNELGDPDDLIVSKPAGEAKDPLYDWRDSPKLKLLNLVYDLTPSECVTAVVTELGMIPPSSVPVIVRERREDAA